MKQNTYVVTHQERTEVCARDSGVLTPVRGYSPASLAGAVEELVDAGVILDLLEGVVVKVELADGGVGLVRVSST